MKRVSLVILIVIGLGAAILPGAASAQSTGSPVMVLRDGNLFVLLNGGLAALTLDGNVQSAALSPDGRWFAYLTLSPLSVDALERVGPIGGGPLPADIGLVPTNAADSQAVAVQPPDASFFVDGVADNALLRSTPTWSPDSTKIAWAEVHYPSFAPESNRIVVYDLQTGTTQILVSNLPESAGVPSPLEVRWGGGGLAVLSFRFDATDASMDTAIQVYSTGGGLISETVIPDDDTHHFADFGWVTALDGSQMVGVLFSGGNWELINPQNGERQSVTGTVERYSLSNPTTSLALSFTRDPGAEDFFTSYVWTATPPEGDPIPVEGVETSPNSVALAPDGQSVAYITADGGINIWNRSGETSTLAEPGTADLGSASLFWGPEGWRLRGFTVVIAPSTEPTAGPTLAPTPTVLVCGDTLPPRLTIGGQGRVLPGLPNVMRSLPQRGPDSQIVGEIPGGAVFQVLEGPQCDAEGHNWWRVNFNGVIGWTPEGDPVQYWVEPVP